MQDVTTNLCVKVNDVNVCRAYGNMVHFGNTGTCTAVVELAAGDLVNVKILDNGTGDGGVVLGPHNTVVCLGFFWSHCNLITISYHGISCGQ